ncbi:MAG: transporter substrate-binding domain-containing protein [Cyclobacteriaceae bacterium]
MKRSKIFLLALLSLLVFFTSIQGTAQHSGDSFADAKTKGTATLTYVYEGVEGFSDQTSSGEFKGLLVDIMSRFEEFVSEKHGINITSQYVAVKDKDFSQFLLQVQNGDGGVFGVSPVSIREDRMSILQFSPAYLNNISVLITNKSVPTLASMDRIASDFSGMKAYTVPSTTFDERVQSLKSQGFSSLQISNVPSMYEMVDNVAKDERSFCFADLNYYFDFLQKGNAIKRHPVGDLKGDEWGIIMPLNSDWQPIIADFFNSGFLKSPEYRQMIIDNLGKWALRMIE